MALLLDVTGRGDENANRLHYGTPCAYSIPYRRHHLQKFGRVLETAHRVLREEYLKENDERLRDTFELFHRQGRVLMLIHHLNRGASERRLTSQHLPKRHAQRVQVRADVHANSGELFGAGELWGP